MNPQTGTKGLNKTKSFFFRKPRYKVASKKGSSSRAEEVFPGYPVLQHLSEIFRTAKRTVIPCGRRSYALLNAGPVSSRVQSHSMQPSTMTSRAQNNSNSAPTLIPSKSVEIRKFTEDVEHFDIKTEMNSMYDVEKAVERNAIKKAHTAVLKICILGMLSGWWVGLCAIMSQQMAGGIPKETRDAWPMLPKLLTGLCFPSAICFIVFLGCELFTGNAMTMLVGVWSRRITKRHLLVNWVAVLFSNFAGCVATVYFFGYLTGACATEPVLSWVIYVAEKKMHLKPEVAFLRAIPANALVCTSVMFGLSAKDILGKIVAMWFPISVFVFCGYEHAIANMAFVPLGLMYGAEGDWVAWLYGNLILVILGNIVGGGLVIGGFAYLNFDWAQHSRDLKKDEQQPSNANALHWTLNGRNGSKTFDPGFMSPTMDNVHNLPVAGQSFGHLEKMRTNGTPANKCNTDAEGGEASSGASSASTFVPVKQVNYGSA